MTATLQRHRFTVADYHRLGEAGVLAEDDRVELIDGDIVEMSPIGSSHAGLVDRLTRWFVEHVSDRALVSVQNPLRIGARSEPQPDLLLLKPRPDDYLDDHPQPADVLLLVEVAESSYQDKVKVTFYKGASLDDPAGLFDASLNGNTRRAIDLHEGDEIDERACKALVRAAAALNASRA